MATVAWVGRVTSNGVVSKSDKLLLRTDPMLFARSVDLIGHPGSDRCWHRLFRALYCVPRVYRPIRFIGGFRDYRFPCPSLGGNRGLDGVDKRVRFCGYRARILTPGWNGNWSGSLGELPTRFLIVALNHIQGMDCSCVSCIRDQINFNSNLDNSSLAWEVIECKRT